MKILQFCLSVTASLLLSSSLLAGLDDLRGTWQLDRSQSESMRDILAAQGYTSFEIGILLRVTITQVIEPNAAARTVTIRTKTSVVGTTESLTLDDVERPADSPLGKVERAAIWDAPGRALRSRTRYQARNGQRAQLTTTRRPLDAQRFAQETHLKLADGREFRARQLFVRP